MYSICFRLHLDGIFILMVHFKTFYYVTLQLHVNLFYFTEL